MTGSDDDVALPSPRGPAALAILAVYAAAVAGVMAVAIRQAAGMGDALSLALWFAWTIGPIGIGGALDRIGRPSPAARSVYLVLLALIGVAGLVSYADTFLLNEPPPKAGLVFLFIPAFQYIGVLILFLISLFWRLGRR